MIPVLNDIDRLLQAADTRYGLAVDRDLRLSASALAFDVALDASVTPAAIVFIASTHGMAGTVQFTTDNGTPLVVVGNVATLTPAALVGSGVIVTASLTVEGQTYVARQAIVRLLAFDSSVPPAPTDLATVGALASIQLSWAATNNSNIAKVEIWRALTNSLAAADPVGSTAGLARTFADNIGAAGAFYYWIRYISKANVIGPFNSTAGTLGAAGTDADHLLALLTDRVSESQLFGSLRDRIALVDTPGTGLVDKVGALVTTYGDTAASASSAAAAAQSAADAVAAKAAAMLAAGDSTGAATAADNYRLQAQSANVAAGNSAGAALTSENNAASYSESAGTAAAASNASKIAADAASGAAQGSATSAVTARDTAVSKASEASTSASAASTSATTASTKAGEASSSATSAATSASGASGAANSASTSANNAATSRDNASGSASAASGSASTASTHASNAGTSASAANTARVASESARDASAGSASAASTSASTAGTHASNAGTSASAASGSANTASTKAGESSSSATSAATSASGASGSANSASTSAGNAATSRDNASGSASAAAGSASTAGTHASNAGTSASAANTALVSAESARDASAGSASAASTSASTAGTHASNAGTSASAASGSANTASTKAGEALSYRNSAATSESNAQGYANAAAQDYTAVNARLNNAGGAGVTVEQKLTASANSITGLNGQYTVKVDNNGYVSGFGLASTAVNGAPTSAFIILADAFYVVGPSGPAPMFSVGGGVVGFSGKLVGPSGHFGIVTIGDGGSLSSGQTAYNVGIGFWMQGGSTPKLSMKTSNGASLLCDPANNVLSFTGGLIDGTLAATVVLNAENGSAAQTSLNNPPVLTGLHDIYVTGASNGVYVNYDTLTAAVSGGAGPFVFTWVLSTYFGLLKVSSASGATVTISGKSTNSHCSGLITCTVTAANGMTDTLFAYIDTAHGTGIPT